VVSRGKCAQCVPKNAKTPSRVSGANRQGQKLGGSHVERPAKLKDISVTEVTRSVVCHDQLLAAWATERKGKMQLWQKQRSTTNGNTTEEDKKQSINAYVVGL